MIIPTFRRPEALTLTLRSLTNADYPPELYEVIVVDDGDDEATRRAVQDVAAAERSVVYVSQRNAGVATARNCGAGIASGELLIFLDDDMIVESTHIRDHLTTQDVYGHCLTNGHWEFAPDVREALARTPFGRFRISVEEWVKRGIAKRPLDESCSEPAEVTAANLGIPRAAFEALGGFDEGFPLAGCEDQEFSHRAAEAGYQLIYNSRIRLLHNDHRMTLRQFCERQEQGALTAVYLASKHPAKYAGRPLMTENAPVSPDDRPLLVAKKLAKRVLSAGPILSGVHRGIEFLERTQPESRYLPRAYWSVCGLHLFRGIRQGLAKLHPGINRWPLPRP